MLRPIKVLFIFGTRPEAIKLSPVILHLQSRPEFETRVCVTGQHREMLDSVLQIFSVRPDYDLDVMLPGQSLYQATSRILPALEKVLTTEMPDLVLVQGDTTTTFAGALAAFYAKTTVGHVEAGLRTWDRYQPFPEEMNRLLSSRLAELHFAATAGAARNLRKEGIENGIHITGNPGIDAVLYVRDRLASGELRASQSWDFLEADKKLVTVTAHRRESFGAPFETLCEALRTLAQREELQIVYPVHPNPNVREAAYRNLSGRANIVLIEPLDYISFVDLMRRSYMLLTDSGGVQEEGPSLGKPVLVLRDKTERPEAIEAGTVRLSGTSSESIVNEATLLLDDPEEYKRRSLAHSPYGDGLASGRIAQAIFDHFRQKK